MLSLTGLRRIGFGFGSHLLKQFNELVCLTNRYREGVKGTSTNVRRQDNSSALVIGLKVYGLNDRHDLLLLRSRGRSFAQSVYDLNGFGGRDAKRDLATVLKHQRNCVFFPSASAPADKTLSAVIGVAASCAVSGPLMLYSAKAAIRSKRIKNLHSFALAPRLDSKNCHKFALRRQNASLRGT